MTSINSPLSVRGVYRHEQLRRLISPASVAVIGASQSPTPFGSRVIAKLQEANFQGEVYPVNPKYAQIGGKTCYPSIAELPSTPDCIVIAVPREAVESAVIEAAQRGVGGAIIFSSGYAETGKVERIAQQELSLIHI